MLAPVPDESRRGTIPIPPTSAVISTGRSRLRAATLIASSGDFPADSCSRTKERSNTPFWIATPKRAMNPMEAGMLKNSPKDLRATTPPTREKGMFKRIRSVWSKDPKFQ